MAAREYVVVSRYSGKTAVAGPYSRRQARQVAADTPGNPRVVGLARPTLWTTTQDDLDRYKPRPVFL